MKIEFSGNGWINVQEKICGQLDMPIPNQDNSVDLRKIKIDAQLTFLDWAQENTPAVPHHLLKKNQKRKRK